MSCLFSHIIVIDKGSCSQFQRKKKGSIKKKKKSNLYRVLGGSDRKESTCNAGDLDSIPGLGRSSGGGHGNLLQYSCLETTEPPGKPLSFNVYLLIEKISFLLKDLGLSYLDCSWHWICGCSRSLILLTGYEFSKGRIGLEARKFYSLVYVNLYCDLLTF